MTTYTDEEKKLRYQRKLADMRAKGIATTQAESIARRYADGVFEDGSADVIEEPLDDDLNAGGVDDSTVNDVALIRGDTVRMQPVRWIWEGWLAAGKFHVLAGQPGVGKSTIALALAATITCGGRWPDGTQASTGSVLIWSGEDDPADTLAPRLRASGADLSRVLFVGDAREGLERMPFDPARHMVTLQKRAALTGDIRLVVVDPVVSAVMGDSHKNAEVRRSLQPLVDLAASLGCAVLGISHFTKGSSGRDPVERVTGSLAFGALARVVLAAAKLPPDEGGQAKRILARAKSNIGVDYGGFGFDLEQTAVESVPGLFASRVLWGEAIDGTARELLADGDGPDDGDRSQTDEAREWLSAVLRNGSMKAQDVQREAKQAGISERALRRARERLGIKPHKDGFTNGWRWALHRTEDAPPLPEDAQGAPHTGGGAFDSGGRLRADDDVVEVEF